MWISREAWKWREVASTDRRKRGEEGRRKGETGGMRGRNRECGDNETGAVRAPASVSGAKIQNGFSPFQWSYSGFRLQGGFGSWCFGVLYFYTFLGFGFGTPSLTDFTSPEILQILFKIFVDYIRCLAH